MRHSWIAFGLAPGRLDDVLETVDAWDSPIETALGILRDLAQGERGPHVPQPSVPWRTACKELLKPTAYECHVGFDECARVRHPGPMLVSGRCATCVGQGLDREEPPSGRSSLCRSGTCAGDSCDDRGTGGICWQLVPLAAVEFAPRQRRANWLKTTENYLNFVS